MEEFIKLQYFFKKIPLTLPTSNIHLSGFYRERKTIEHLGLDELYIRILWIKQSSSSVVLISIDTLYISEEISKPIYQHMKEHYQISEDQIIFNATHTHSAPGIEKIFDKQNVDIQYMNYICQTILTVFKEETLNFIEGHISFHSKKISNDLLVSRRKVGRDIKSFFTKKKMLMLPNHNNIIDNELRLFYIFDTNDNLKMTIYNFSCHPVFNTSNNISSDYIGKISQNIKEDLQAESIFLQGFLGDIRPNFTTKKLSDLNIINKFKLLFNKEVFRKFNKDDFNYFTSSLSQDIITACDSIKQNKFDVGNQLKTFKTNYTLESNSANTKKQFDIKFVLINNNIVISIPAEVTSRYKIELSKQFHQFNIIPLGLADGIIGYLPFHDEASAGGYEVESAVNYGWDTFISQRSLENFYIALVTDISSFIQENNNDNKK